MKPVWVSLRRNRSPRAAKIAQVFADCNPFSVPGCGLPAVHGYVTAVGQVPPVAAASPAAA
ncbi:hypothetical protein, partial [Stenotrophomonas pictorum]|uniref:hypothetical protein n=1 Tax=Stenotrophomonas pictorum TaxID=86184 RepID=UPI001C495D27